MSGVLTAATVVTIDIPSVATFVTTLPSGYNWASASSQLASLTSALAAGPAATGTSSSTRSSSAWTFVPILAPAIIATALYGIVTLLLIARMVQRRNWWMTALILGGIMEALGFGARAKCVVDLSNVSLYKMELSCTILAPIFTAAQEYIILGRLMEYVGRRHSLFKPHLVSWVFIVSDAISFLIQVAGAAVLLARPNIKAGATAAEIDNATKLLNAGDNVLLGGLAVNLASFVIFMMQIIWFDLRTRKEPHNFGQWRRLLWVVYISTGFVLIRQIYRVIEFSQGWFGYLPNHEVYFYCFDSLPILLATAMYVWWWPTKYIPGDKRVRLGDGGTEFLELSEKEKKKLGEGQGSGDTVA